MRKRALQVTLDVQQPSVVELTVAERVQLDRLETSPHGYVARRQGDLLERGLATLTLDRGLYFFKTLSDTHLKVIRGGVTASASKATKEDPFPDQTPPSRGDEPVGDAPTLTID